MEGQVTLSLKEYTDLVIENNNLKLLVKQYQRRIKNEVEDEIFESRIAAIKTKDEIQNYFDSKDDVLIGKFTNNYSWKWREISERNYGVTDEKAIKELAVSIIKEKLNYRLSDILEEEKEE